MAAGTWIRAARRARRLSQREVAGLAALPLSTISRIEAGRTVPRLDTFVQLLACMGYELVIVDQNLRMLTIDAEHDRFRDRGDRQFPAHLVAGRTPSYWEGGWWGWERIAWPFAGDSVPEFTFWRRRPPPKTVGEWTVRPAKWDDAT